MKITINTNLFGIVNVGMYNSNLSPKNVFHDYTIDQDNSEGLIHFDSEFFWDKFDNKKYVDRVNQLVKKFLDGKYVWDGIKVKIECGSIYSPKYYNFGTDNMVLTVTYNKSDLIKYGKEHQLEFGEFLRKNYTSYDGFMSFTSNNFQDWLNDFENNDETSVGSILTYLVSNYDTNDLLGLCEYYVIEKLLQNGYMEFLDSTDYISELSVIQKFISENYMELNIDTLDLNQFDLKIISENDCRRLITSMIRNIESHTLSLF